jgi:signal transduction histidine kinase
MTGPAGTLKGFRGVAIDITERKHAEIALRQVIKKLTILSSITRHDILNKLSVLRGFLTMVKRNVTEPKLLEYIASEESAAAAIEHQISFTRDYENIGVNAPQWQDVRATISLALCQLDPLPFPVSVDIAGLYIYADPLIEKVFYNLVENAIRHGGKVTRISFFCQESADGLTITCEDDGKGIPDSEKENIFTRKYYRHTGLGLFLSREILDMTGITIRECGNEGAGARFEISVPKAAFRFGEKPQEPVRCRKE